MALHICSIYV